MLPIVAMLLLLVIGYGQLGLRIESLLLISAGIAAALAYWQGYRWNDIIDSIVAKLAKAMPVIMILICVGGTNRNLDDQRNYTLYGLLGIKTD